MLPALTSCMARRIALLILALVVAVSAMPGVAQASTYRFWNFWTAQEQSWVYSQLGPASTFPEDGSVQGWVFAATDADSESVSPAIDPSDVFDLACGTTASTANQKRVAFVVDSGTAEIAPEGQTAPELLLVCAVGDEGASGYELLNSVAKLRTENGFICAINAYPAMECSAAFNPTEAPPTEVTTSEQSEESAPVTADQNSALAPVGTALVIGLVAVAGFYYWRRRSH